MTLPVTAITSNSTRLQARVNPSGFPTTGIFLYGTSTNSWNSTEQQDLGQGYDEFSVAADLSGLIPGTTYYFRAVATNIAGTTYGPILAFRTFGTATVTSCEPASLSAALSADALIRLECDGTITLPDTLVINHDTTLDGSGHNIASAAATRCGCSRSTWVGSR
jgi:hypothetical protein